MEAKEVPINRWGDKEYEIYILSSVQLLSRVQLFAAPWIAAHQASLSITNSRSSLKLMPSSHLILCCPLLLLPPVPPSIRVFSNESTLRMRWPKYWSFSFSISPSNEHPGLIFFRMDWLDLPYSPRDSQESSPTPQFKSIISSALSFLYSPTLTSIHDYWKNCSLKLCGCWVENIRLTKSGHRRPVRKEQCSGLGERYWCRMKMQ